MSPVGLTPSEQWRRVEDSGGRCGHVCAQVHEFISSSGLLNGKPLEQSDIESV